MATSKSGLNSQSEWVNSTLAKLSLEQKIGQLLHPFIRTNKPQDEAIADLDGIEVGGAFFFPESKEYLQNLSSKLQTSHQVPVVISSDLENGAGRMVKDATIFPDSLAVAATGNAELAYIMGEAAAKEGRECGIHWSFGPVVDINANPHNPITNTRSFGDNLETINACAANMQAGMQDHQLAACPKHFPGDGFDDRDQHLCTSVNPLTMEQWRATSGKAFQEIIDAGAWTIMIGHISLPAYDPALNGRIEEAPSAVISHKLTTELLRNELGFDGLIISDAIGMGGSCTHYPESEVVLKSIEAGCDMILFCKTRSAFDDILAAVKSGRISIERIEESVRRVLALKEKLDLADSVATGNCSDDDKTRFKNTAQTIAEKSLTLIRNAPRKPLKAGMNVLSLHYRGDPLYQVDDIDRLLIERGLKVTRFSEDAEQPFPDWGNLADYDAILIHTVFGPSWATNRIRLSGNLNRPLINAIKSHHPNLYFTSFGNPYQLYEHPRLPWYLNAYSPDKATQEAYVKLLFGELEATGQTPVDVEKLFKPTVFTI